MNDEPLGIFAPLTGDKYHRPKRIAMEKSYHRMHSLAPHYFYYKNEYGHTLCIMVLEVRDLVDEFNRIYRDWGLQGTYKFIELRSDYDTTWQYYGQWIERLMEIGEL